MTAEPFRDPARGFVSLELGLIGLACGEDFVVPAVDKAEEEPPPNDGQTVEHLNFKARTHHGTINLTFANGCSPSDCDGEFRDVADLGTDEVSV
jgi:hypothetical protein